MEVVRRWISKLMRVECCRELLLVLLCSCLFSVTGTKNEGFSNGDGNELCFPVVGDIGGIPQHPYSTWTQRKVAILLGKVYHQLLMRRSNRSYPSPPRQPRGQRKNVCNKKGRGTGKKSDYTALQEKI